MSAFSQALGRWQCPLGANTGKAPQHSAGPKTDVQTSWLSPPNVFLPLFILDLQALRGPYFVSLSKPQCSHKLLDLQPKQNLNLVPGHEGYPEPLTWLQTRKLVQNR